MNWQPGTVLELIEQTARTKSIVFDVPGWGLHRAGQHVDVRLTAEDGYQAQRSYSIASAPEDRHIELTVERIDDGEVSPYLADELLPGDEIELRGPIGGYFAWEEAPETPVFLVGGGSGIVPLRAMLRHHSATGSAVPVRLLYSARSLEDVIYRDELTAADRRPSTAAMPHRPRAQACCMRSPRSRTADMASANVRTPAVTAAAKTPTECPATKAGTRPRSSIRARAAATPEISSASWTLVVDCSASAVSRSSRPAGQRVWSSSRAAPSPLRVTAGEAGRARSMSGRWEP